MSLSSHFSPAEAAEYEALLCERMARAGPAAQKFHLRRVAARERSRTAAAQAKQSAGHTPSAPRDAEASRRERTPAQVARKQRSDKKLRQKHLARKLQAAIRIRDGLYFWHLRAAERLVRRYSEGAINPLTQIPVEETGFIVSLTQLYHPRSGEPSGMKGFTLCKRLAV